jgi:hypothetical protein
MLPLEEEMVERGRRTALIIGGVLVALELLMLAGLMTRTGAGGAARPLVRIGLTITLAIALYQGYQWARWGLVILVFAAFLLGNFTLSGPLSEQLPVLLMLAVYIVIGRTLLYSRTLAAFMRRQRGEPAVGPRRR